MSNMLNPADIIKICAVSILAVYLFNKGVKSAGFPQYAA